jgi:glycosyltransferase involved in cell wall biosynthesis
MDNVIIISKMPFPEGFASTIRFTTYSRGLLADEMSVNVLCIKPTEQRKSIKNSNVKGIHEGIEFEYTSGNTVRNKYLILRPLVNFRGFLISLVRILSLKKEKNTKAIILIGPFGTIKELILFIVSRFLKIKYIQERSEYPFILQRGNLINKFNLWLYLTFSCKLFDGMILISNVLADYFKKYVSKKAELFILPIVVEPERFNTNSNVGKSKSKYIAYCGSMNSNKDGIDCLIESFEIIAPNFPDLSLRLIGRTDFPDFVKLQDKVKSMNFTERIIFTGRVTNEEMTELLNNALLLVLARPETIQAKANFPTKIGEYCSTGKPIITTRVGSISDYFIHGKNAYLAEPGNSVDFALKMEEALSDYNKALEIGVEGKKLAYSTFNYIFQGKRLASFLRSKKYD